MTKQKKQNKSSVENTELRAEEERKANAGVVCERPLSYALMDICNYERMKEEGYAQEQILFFQAIIDNDRRILENIFRKRYNNGGKA